MASEVTSPMVDEMAYSRQQIADTLAYLKQHPDEENSVSGFLYDLRKDVEHYDAVVNGEITSFSIDSLADLPTVLIDVRRARNLSKPELAKLWGLSAEDTQKLVLNESDFYARKSLAGIVSAAIILGVELTGSFNLEERQ